MGCRTISLKIWRKWIREIAFSPTIRKSTRIRLNNNQVKWQRRRNSKAQAKIQNKSLKVKLQWPKKVKGASRRKSNHSSQTKPIWFTIFSCAWISFVRTEKLPRWIQQLRSRTKLTGVIDNLGTSKFFWTPRCFKIVEGVSSKLRVLRKNIRIDEKIMC